MVKLVGEGGQGVVELQANGTVWKRLKDPTNRDSMESFLAEIQLLSALSHGNIITGSGLDASGPASGAILAMEFVPGGTLQALLMRQMQGRPGSRLYRCRDALRWSTQLASALSYLHVRSPMIIFRDLSAANVLLTSTVPTEADIKLIDFGLHKCLPAHADGGKCGDATLQLQCSAGRVPCPGPMTGETGSYTYMAPEVVKHERYNEKVDVFSLGCLMHELFSRELRSAALLSKGPDAQLLQNYALRVAGGHRPAIPVSFPQPLARLITACWAQSPAQRPSAAAVLAELQRMAATGALDAMDARPRGLFSCFG